LLEISLRKAVEFLDAERYRYAIIGGLALAQWGVVRATYDADIKLLAPDYDYAATRAAVRAAFPEDARPELPKNGLIVAVRIDDATVDFLLALPGYEEQIIERAILRDLGGWQAWFCSAEDLIVQKAVAGRDKDWMDIRALLRQHYHALDHSYIEDWLAQFAEALIRPELVAEYRRASTDAGANME
jgi:hypothetical protein